MKTPKTIEYEEFLRNTEYGILEPYTTALTKINHVHKTCGATWNVTPNAIKNRIKKGITTGCPSCAKAYKLCHSDYEKRLEGTEFKVLEHYKGNSKAIKHLHIPCGNTVEITPVSIMNQKRSGCSFCGKTAKISTEVYLYKIKELEYELLEEYTGSKDKLLHKHKTCGAEIRIRPNDLLSGHGCSKCSTGRTYSKIAIQWLDSFNNPNIKHAENGGEVRIEGYLVDGFDSETNTVYEFHGDVFHGNLDIYGPDDTCHPFNKSITADELWQKTFDKMQDIHNKGYRLIYIWEFDYRNNKTHCVF